MKRNLRFLAGAFLLTATALFTGCNSDDDFLMEPMDSATPQTRAQEQPNGSYVITFEEATGSLAGPTSYGANLYSSYGDSQYKSWTDPDAGAVFAINENYGNWDFWNGGIAISNWCIRKNVDGNTHDWWYSYQNQCSVYNTAVSEDTLQGGAGYNSSNNFAVVYGYVDAYNADYMNYPEISFSDAGTVSDLWICNSAYTYGVIMNGNHWDDGEDDGWTGTAVPLKTLVDATGKKGYLRVDAYGFNGNNATNNGNPVSIYLADYNANAETGNVITTWTAWNLSALGNVTKIKFNVVGNDSGQYGLNTPAYFCLDNIHFTPEE